MIRAAVSLALLVTAAVAQTAPPKAKAGAMLYVGCWPNKVLVIDEAQEKVVDEVLLQTGVPRSMTLSTDKKKLFVTTMKDSGIETIDLASRKVVSHFLLNEGNRRVRPSGLAPDPSDKLLYTMGNAVVKQIDRFEVEKSKFMVIDLEQKKVTKTVDLPKEDDHPFGRFSGLRVSPDGKFLFVFRENVLIYDTTDFKQVEKIELSKPLYPGMEHVTIGGADDPHEQPGEVFGLFLSSDPVVHRSIFGIARFDLTKRTFDFTPVGPSTTGMSGLRVTPDRKTGYTVAFIGSGGNRRTEFWVFDLASRKVTDRREFDGRSRFNFTISSTGKQFYIHGAGDTIEIYDAATMRMKKVIDIKADMTTGLVVVPGAG